jgi:hypothetical protein
MLSKADYKKIIIKKNIQALLTAYLNPDKAMEIIASFIEDYSFA